MQQKFMSTAELGMTQEDYHPPLLSVTTFTSSAAHEILSKEWQNNKEICIFRGRKPIIVTIEMSMSTDLNEKTRSWSSKAAIAM